MGRGQGARHDTRLLSVGGQGFCSGEGYCEGVDG